MLIRDCILTNASGTLGPLLPMLAPNLEVIQVHGLCVVGTPVGTSDYVREYETRGRTQPACCQADMCQAVLCTRASFPAQRRSVPREAGRRGVTCLQCLS
jgi:hypothetical protein